VPEKGLATGWRTIGEAPDAGKTLSAGRSPASGAVIFSQIGLVFAASEVTVRRLSKWI
jgi:hypothetical protein